MQLIITTMSNRIAEILEVLAEVRERHLEQLSADITATRIQAVDYVATHRGIDERSVLDKCTRQLQPEIKEAADFDRLVESWLMAGSEELKKAILKHASDSDDVRSINNFFGIPIEKAGGSDALVAMELERRMGMWASVLERGSSNTVAPQLLRELGIYGGAQGVWVDKERTSKITADGTGVTVGLLHTGSSYADDMSEDAVLYHYPKTNRPAARDKSEVDATKAAGRLRLPVFVIKYPTPNSNRREVRLGWVEDWDDDSGLFLISFGEAPQQTFSPAEEVEQPFEPFSNRQMTQRTVNVRKGQQQFKFDVIKRYGARCAVCGIDFVELLDGAHIIPNRAAGSYDARNGLVLCALHHRAFDAGMFAIEPNTLKIHFASPMLNASRLHIINATIEHLTKKPHVQALEWHWQKWQR